MSTIAELVGNFLTNEHPLSVVLDPPTVLAQAVAAAKFYAGYALLEEFTDSTPPYPDIDDGIDLSDSEWALIKPLFFLYVERETATHLEASRGSGGDAFVFGRSSSEIDQDIANAHREMPMNAFFQPIETI